MTALKYYLVALRGALYPVWATEAFAEPVGTVTKIGPRWTKGVTFRSGPEGAPQPGEVRGHCLKEAVWKPH